MVDSEVLNEVSRNIYKIDQKREKVDRGYSEIRMQRKSTQATSKNKRSVILTHVRLKRKTMLRNVDATSTNNSCKSLRRMQ